MAIASKKGWVFVKSLFYKNVGGGRDRRKWIRVSEKSSTFGCILKRKKKKNRE